MSDRTYVEPFAGGAGLALKFLFEGDVPSIILNDVDPAIANFWRTVLAEPGYLCDRLFDTPVDMESWVMQRAIYEDESKQWTPEHAFATLFLNRTNRAGILRGGPVGGKSQSGVTKLDARLTPTTIDNLCKKIEKIYQHREQIQVFSDDAGILLEKLRLVSDQHFVYADPPYIGKGSALYHNSFSQKDHCVFSRQIVDSGCAFIVSYDEHPLAREIYRELRMRYLTLRYSLNSRQSKREYLFFSKDLRIPSELEKA